MQIQPLDFFSCPWCFAKEFQTRFDRWIAGETFDVDLLTKLLPTKRIHEMFNDVREFDSMKWVVWLIVHGVMVWE